MKFNKICVIDVNELQLYPSAELEQYSKLLPIFVDEIPGSAIELADTIGDADCLLTNVTTSIPESVFNSCPNLKYVGMFARALSRVDIKAANRNNVTVTNINNWCDWETAEFVMASILYVHRAFGSKKWINAPQSLKEKQLGIIGFGEVGGQVAEFAKSFGMKIVYHNRKEKNNAKALGYEYLSLKELMRTSDVVSLHVPPDCCVLGKDEFDVTPEEVVLVNTCVGKVFENVHFEKWINNKNHFALFDQIAGGEIESYKDYSNVYVVDADAYLTPGVSERRIRRLLDNIKNYLS
ncbi:MAG: hypothetical protein GY756_24900 [bacterium]|nr:hypothetical protein [bacterium]